MPDTTLFHTDLDEACCRRSLAEGRLRESEDARMEPWHLVLATSLTGLGEEVSSQGVIQWSERKVASW